MGLVTVTDQHGNPPPQNDGCGQPERLFVQFVPLEGPFANGTPMTDRFTDNLGKIGTEGIPQTFQTQKYELRCNEANVNPNYATARVRTNDLEHENVQIVVNRTGTQPGPTPPPGLSVVSCIYDTNVKGKGAPNELKVLVHAIVAKLPAGAIMEPDFAQGGNGKQPNMKFVDDELKKILCKFQNSERGEGYLKPRIMAWSDLQDGHGPPESQCGEYSRPIDIGSFGLPFFHGSEGNTDVWQLTGRPPSSQW